MNAILPVRAFTDPIRGIAGPPVEFQRPERATLADIIALVPLENEALRPHLRVKLGGVLIDPSLYHRVLPKQDAFLTIVLPVHGGDNLLGTIAAVALIGASLVFSAGLAAPLLGTAFAAGGIGATLVAGGLSIAASLLLQGLNAPTGLTAEKNSAAEIGVASAQNGFEPGSYLPRVMGTRKIAPPMVMPPYTETNGDIQYVYAVYGLAGPHKIEDIKIGATAIANANDVEYEVREGFASDTNLTLVTKTVIEDSIGLQMSEFISSSVNGNDLDATVSPNRPQWHRLQTRTAPDVVKLGFLFDRGLHWVESGDTAAVTAFRVRIRRKGAVSWSNLPEFVIYGKRSTASVRLEIEFQWLASGSMPGSVAAFTPNYRGFAYKYQSVTEVTGAANTYWTADSYYATNKIDWISPQKLKVYLDTSTFPQDAYEIEAIRGMMVREADFTPGTHVIGTSNDADDFFTTKIGGLHDLGRVQDDFMRSLRIVYLQSIWNEYPFDLSDQPTALLCIKARNRSIDQVSCVASGYTENWNGSTWVAYQITKNPASWYREVLTGPYNAEPSPTSLVDMSNLQDWHEWNAARGNELNAIVQGQPVTEVLSVVAQAGFARPRYGATHGVVIDRPRSLVGLVSQRNASGFSFQKPFGRLPHALRVNLSDETNDYEVREVVVYADGYAASAGGGLLEATRFESVTYPGITTEAQATARAERDMRFGRYRSRLINFSMDIEHLEFQLGDLVLLETDILGQMGGRGRVSGIETSGGLVTGLVLDEERDFTHADANTLPRGVAIRLGDGTLRFERVTADDSDLNRVVFQTPFAMPTSGGDDLIEAGTLVVSGTLGREARKVLIWDMAPGPDLTCQITAIDYAEVDVYGTYTFAAARGLVTISGQAASINFTGRSIVAGQGAFALSGQSAGFVRALQLVAGQGSFAINGQAANFLRAVRLPADVGSFSISGQAASFLMARRLTADQGSFALSGQAANFARSLMLGASVGTLAISGQAASFALGKALTADFGSYTLSGQSAAFARALRLAADQGSFAINGQAASVLASRTIAAAAGTFAISGQDAVFVVPGTSPLAIVSSNTSAETTNANTATVNLPASIVAGNLLVMLFQSNGSTTPNIPSGWSRIGSSITNGDTLTVLAKIASGSEGATVAMTLAASATGRSAHITYQISGNRNGVTTAELQLTTVSGGSGDANPNPPNNAPGWGSVQALWFAIAGINNGSSTVSAYPSGYTLGQNTINGNTGGTGTRVAAAAKLATASADDPGTFTLAATDTWTAATLAIRPQ